MKKIRELFHKKYYDIAYDWKVRVELEKLQMSLQAAIGELLIDLECELRNMGLWENEAPPPEALESAMPFAVDTLTFPQWVQFVFIAKMHLIIKTDAPLPEGCGIAPMCEEYFRESAHCGRNLTRIFLRLDKILN